MLPLLRVLLIVSEVKETKKKLDLFSLSKDTTTNVYENVYITRAWAATVCKNVRRCLKSVIREKW
jgi:hypothetical protein